MSFSTVCFQKDWINTNEVSTFLRRKMSLMNTFIRINKCIQQMHMRVDGKKEAKNIISPPFLCSHRVLFDSKVINLIVDHGIMIQEAFMIMLICHTNTKGGILARKFKSSCLGKNDSTYFWFFIHFLNFNPFLDFAKIHYFWIFPSLHFRG